MLLSKLQSKLPPPLRQLNWQHVFTLGFIIGVLLVSHTLLRHPQSWMQFAYLSYPCGMLLAKFSARRRKHAALVAALAIILGGVLSPLDLEVIEESFILVPLLFVMLFPGAMWPIVFAVLMLLPYYLGTPPGDQAGFIEDAIELLVITSFAAVMAFFQQRSHQQMLAYRQDSRTDYLTQLANRLAYSMALKEIDERPLAERCSYALILLDLDDFKRINDLFGHRYGDLLLREFSRRMSKIDTIQLYRIGGDEFAVLHQERRRIAASAEAIANAISQATRLPYAILGREFQVSVSIGIALYDADNGHSELVTRNADLALYQAKAQGKNTVAMYHPELLASRSSRDRMERELAHALSAQQLFLVYQAKVDLNNGKICGMEALIRWQHPEMGLISPIDFIPLAEETRLIVPIGRWVLVEACHFAVQCQLPVSVNVSAVQMAHDDLLAAVNIALQSSGLPAALLEIEITETSMMDNIEQTVPMLHQLRAKGIKIAVDDFGVAYSSLSQLTQLPIDVLKIDKSFVDRCLDSERDKMLIRTIVQLGHNLQLSVLAEGVENEQQHQLLVEKGCQQAQGYWYARPLSGLDFQSKLESK